MGLFQTLKDKIFGHADEAKAATVQQQPAQRPAAAPAAMQTQATQTATATQGKPVDVEQTLEYMARKSGQPSNWRESIVDLMKLVGMDSSLSARKELAQDLGYTGDMNDSASMNIWLHKKVMERLATSRA